MKRRTFLALGCASIGLAALPSGVHRRAMAAPEAPFKISLAQWSLHRSLFAKKLDNLDLPRAAKRDFGIDCVELVDQFFKDKAGDTAYLNDLRKRADDEGVRIGLIMLDTNGPLGSADKAERAKAVEATYTWIDAAKILGCSSVRVNARGPEDPEALRAGLVESCVLLADFAAARGLNVAIENHGGPSSDPAWLNAVMKEVNKPNFGTLPDFGNFPEEVNRYDAVEALLPFAKAVSAKAAKFSENDVLDTDFRRMMRLVRDAGYSGYVGVESAPASQEEEAHAICITRDVLKRIRDEQGRCRPLFNGKNLAGWTIVEGGDWRIENDVLVGAKGQNWSTDPEKTGSWLRTVQTYDDFRLELQYTINEGGNSGVFFRSAAMKNPAFTGYEMQILDFFGQAPTKQGATAIYDTVAPLKNMVRPAGQWNTATIIAKGPKITIEMNGEQVLETELNRSLHGYIGLQNHDDHAVVQFRNIRIEVL